MNEVSVGSRWYKFDFHTHTPESSDYTSKTDAPEDWLKACMAAEIDCVAVTDHVAGGWIDSLKVAYDGLDRSSDWYRPLTIFPGVEITVSTGVSRVHLLAIFDPRVNTAKINGVLGKCGITDGHGDAQDTCSAESIDNVIKIVHEQGGVLIPAHIDRPKGLLHGIMNTNAEIKVWISKLTAAEFVDHQYLEGVNEELRADAKHLAKLSGSDAHKIDDLGTKYSWIKMGVPSISGLGLALHDSDFCVINGVDNPNVTPNLFIESLEIISMVHCGRVPGKPAVFSLHPSFNAVIGGRGSGKSTFIEALRMSMGRVSELVRLPVIKREVDFFVNGVCIADTRIIANLRRREELYRCIWEKNGAHQIEKKVGNDWIADHGTPGERFHVSIYSQKQINALSSDPNSLLGIIDRSTEVDKAGWDRIYKTEVESFVAVSQEVRRLEVSILNESAIQAQLEDVNSDISSFEKGGHGELFSKYQTNSGIQAKLDNAGNIDGFKVSIAAVSNSELAKLDLAEFENNGVLSEQGQELAKIQESFETEVSRVKDVITALYADLENAEIGRVQQIDGTNWVKGRNTVLNQYNTVAEEYREKGEKLDPDEYEQWLNVRNNLNTQLEIIGNQRTELQKKKKHRSRIHRRLYILRRALQRQRIKFVERVLGDNKYVRMSLQPFSDLLILEKQYRSHVGIETAFASSILQEETSNGLLNILTKDISDLKQKVKAVASLKTETRELANNIDVNGLRVDARLKSALGQRLEEQPESFDRLDAWWPDDKLVVEYAKDPVEGKFENIEKGSAGQKAAAILAFLLSHGDDPIIVDQPEDDLDNALIYQLIVSQIHQNKKRRQIIVVTHNPNIVVNGDSEMVNVLEFRGGQVQVLDSGGLSEETIRTHICEIMEGGVEAFEKRYKRILMK